MNTPRTLHVIIPGWLMVRWGLGHDFTRHWECIVEVDFETSKSYHITRLNGIPEDRFMPKSKVVVQKVTTPLNTNSVVPATLEKSEKKEVYYN